MNIYITPVLKKIKSETYLCIDDNLIKFLKKNFKNSKIEFSDVIKDKPHLIVFAGGNNLTHLSKSKEDKIRNNINLKTFNYGLKKKIKMIGICAGAQFIAKKFGSTISKLKGHIGNHKIYINKDYKTINLKKNYAVNSYHNFGITRISKKLLSIAISKDKSIEFFQHKNKKIFGIMWHPERYKKFREFDKKIFKKILWN
jgi:gamma-glutamyl-gamma-aminobutyrate hydrolase PuuD